MRLLDAEREPTVLGVMRMGIGALVVVQSVERLWDVYRSGYFGDVFHMPILPEPWVPSAAMYVALQLVAVAGGLAAVLGPWGREGLLTASSLGLYLLLANRLDYHNNRFALFLVGFLLAFAPCDRSFFLLGRPRASSGPAPFFAIHLIRLQVVAIYLSSSLGKLLDPDWRGGQTMGLRFAEGLDAATAQGIELPAWFTALAGSPAVASAASKAAILTEIFLAVGLLAPKTRAVALYVGVLFHLGIELSARVELFSYVMGVAYVAFVVPETRERVLEVDRSSRLGRIAFGLTSHLDWLRRFRIDDGSPGVLRVVDRDGSAATGVGAWVTLCRALPLLFPLWAPLAVIREVRRSRRAMS